MGKAKRKQKKYAVTKKMLSPKDSRIKANQMKFDLLSDSEKKYKITNKQEVAQR